MGRIIFSIALFILFSFFISTNLFSLNQSEDQGRIKFTINDHWFFSEDSTNWNVVNLPHTWNKDDAYDENVEYRRGAGFYKKNLNINPGWKNKNLFIYFEGANQVADVYINNEYVGQHIGGYTAFVFDVTDYIRFDQENELIVKVDNSHNPDIPPLNADFTFYGGIYRDVWLVVTNSVHIDILNYASPGIFIDTPEISEDKATVRIGGDIVNEKDEDVNVKIINRILDKDHKEIISLQSDLTIPSNSKKSFEQAEIILNPELWSPENPYLYNVVTEIFEDEGLVDKINNPLGFRWFSYDSQKGFFLNNKSHKLIGTNRHQDRKDYGNALPNSMHHEDVELIKENGFNFLRLAHYPQDPEVLNSTDEKGLIVWEEVPIVNLITLSKEFNANCKNMLIEMIRQHYNHPSILMWGYMNEVMLREPESPPPGYHNQIVKLAEHLEEIVHHEDPYRASVMAISHGEIDNRTGLGNVSDILGMNLYFGWYYQKLETLGEFLDEYHKKHPDRPFMISEYGAGSDERVHSDNPVAYDFSTEFQQIYHEASYKQIEERNYLLGSAVWNQFDFGSSHRHDTKPLINQKGLYYFNRIAKEISYYYKAKLLKEPILHIASDDHKIRNSKDEEQILIYSNLDSVSLFVNDLLIDTKEIKNCTVRFFVNLNEGKNFLIAKGEKDNLFVEDRFEIINKTSLYNVAVNCGARYKFIDEDVWQADQNGKKVTWTYSGGEAARTYHKILETNKEPLYQSAIEGIELYKFNVPDGNYNVELCLSEIKTNKVGERIFNIYVNDNPVFTNLDLAKDYGQFIAVNRTINVTAENNEGITIRFTSSKGKSIINGIKINLVN